MSGLNPCDDISTLCPAYAANGDTTFREAVLALLKALVAAGGGGGGGSFAVPTAAAPHTEANVNVTTASTQILASYGARKGATVRNISDSDIWVSNTSPAANTKPKLLPSGEELIIGDNMFVLYTGALYAIHYQSGNKVVEVLEY